MSEWRVTMLTRGGRPLYGGPPYSGTDWDRPLLHQFDCSLEKIADDKTLYVDVVGELYSSEPSEDLEKLSIMVADAITAAFPDEKFLKAVVEDSNLTRNKDNKLRWGRRRVFYFDDPKPKEDWGWRDL